jgi:hypothetical protein
LDLHVSMGTIEKFADGTYSRVPPERLIPEQLAWLEVQQAREDRAPLLRKVERLVERLREEEGVLQHRADTARAALVAVRLDQARPPCPET